MSSSSLPFYPSNGSVNIWIIMITAIFFFIILSWYNVGIEVFNFIFFQNQNSNEIVENFLGESETIDTNTQNLISSIGFALLWTVISFMIYFYLNMNGYFVLPTNVDEKHPILTDEVKVDAI